MIAWDIILPHRLLINRSLRKASEGLRVRVDNYQVEYNRIIGHCSAEIEQAKADKDRDFDNVKSSLMHELSKDMAFFEVVKLGMLDYVNIYFQRQYLYRLRDANRLEMQTLIEYGDFLTKQMKLIGDEIKILEARKDSLVLQAKIDDIVELIGFSGCDFTVDINDNTPALLAKVTNMLEVCDNKDRFRKLALKKLRVILQERVDFLSVIQYISWTIQQKKQFSRQLSSERRKANDSKNDKTVGMRQANENLDAINRKLELQAQKVRGYWEIPTAQITSNITALETISEMDEYRKVSRRLAELYRNEDYKLAERSYNEKVEPIKARKKEKKLEYNAQISSAEIARVEKSNKLNGASSQLRNSKRSDGRSFLYKIFSDTEEVRKAKRDLQKAEAQVSEAEEVLSKLKSSRKSEIRALDRQIESGRPQEHKPSDAEWEKIKATYE